MLQTSSKNVQEIINSRVEKCTKGVFVPIGGKKLLNFIDDFNMVRCVPLWPLLSLAMPRVPSGN